MSRAIYACDVGSVQAGTFAWARVGPGLGNPKVSASIDGLVTQLRQDVETDGMSVALGFESPLFMPVPKFSDNLCRGRDGEGNRSMFAPPGATVATLGVHEAAWILEAIHAQASGVLTYSLDWNGWPPQDGKPRLLLWEAFVSGPAHSPSHAQDAATAAAFFRQHEANLNAVNAVTTEAPFSLIHAASLWSGWAQDLDRLHRTCLVLRPDAAYGGHIDPA